MTVFRYDTFGQTFILRVGIVIFVTVEEHYDVSILLDSTGITKVTEHRFFIVTFFNGTAELRKGYDRNIQIIFQNNIS